MYIKQLQLVNYKNCAETTLNLSPKINCFIGNNGVGKTNILDAIYYLSLCKSYFNSSDHQNIKYGENYFLIKGNYARGEREVEVSCGIKTGHKKTFRRNNKEYTKLSEHIGLIPIVMISPFDSNLIIEGSEIRRKFIDTVISQFDYNYLGLLIKYNKALLQRNKLLKSQHIDVTTIAIYDDILVSCGEEIHNARLDFIKQITPIFNKYYEFISQGNEVVNLEYKSQLNNGDLLAQLQASFDRDKILQYTTVGVHRDDIVMTLQGYPIKQAGSQGQQKTYLTALKFAKFEFIQKISDVKPLLLLDDIFDKYDTQRVEQIIKIVSDKNFGQIFITDTNKNRIDEILKKISYEHSIFQVIDGVVELI